MRYLRALALSLLLALVIALPASAHSLLVRSSPETNAEMLVAPATIEMWFSEPLESTFTGARLIGPSGEEVPTGAAVVNPADPTHLTLPLGSLEPGIYTMAWQTLSQVDGHEWFGSFPITVLNPDGSMPSGSAAQAVNGGRGDLPTVGETLTRWLALVGSMLFFGTLVFWRYVIPETSAPTLRSASKRTVMWVMLSSLGAVILGSLGQALLQADRLGGIGELPQLVIATRTGALVLGRILLSLVGMFAALRTELFARRARAASVVLLAVILLTVATLILAAVEGQVLIPLIGLVIGLGAVSIIGFDRTGKYLEAVSWLLASALLVSFSISSHAGAVQGSLFAVSSDLIHLLAASIWFGGLVLLPLLWFRTRDLDLREQYGIAVRRFSLMAGAAVFVLLLTGLFNSFVELPNLRSLWETPYGLVLLAKLALVVLALMVAFLNNRRLRKADAPAPRGQIAIEAGIAAILLVAVALLVQTPTPRSVALSDVSTGPSLPFSRVTQTNDLNVHVQVDPNQAGKNRFWVHLYHDDASDLGEVQLVRLFFEHSEQELGRSSVDLESLGLDTFAADGAYLSQSGLWDLSVYVRRRGMDDLLSNVQVDVSPGTGSQQTLSTLGNPIPELPLQALLGGLLIAAGAIPILWRRQLSSEFARSYVVGIVLVVVGGVVLVLGVTMEARAGVPLSERSNPVLPSAESIAQGEVMYAESCVLCHGSTGLGDGPVGVTLTPRPANLVVHMIPGVHTDGEILEWITNGFPNSAMPAFGETYSEDEIWHLINYIRTFAPVEGE